MWNNGEKKNQRRRGMVGRRVMIGSERRRAKKTNEGRDWKKMTDMA
jgi:hypothetical protein